jgi:flagellar biosynthetic protein FliR
MMDILASQSFYQVPADSLNLIFAMLFEVIVFSIRIGSFLLAAPFFGSRMVPLNIRIILTFTLSIFLYGWIEIPNVTNLSVFELVGVVFIEASIGLTSGLIFAIAFSTVALVGEKIASTSGLSFAIQMDPATGTQAPIVSQFFTLFLLMIFFATDYHLYVFSIVLESYKIVPIGGKISFLNLYEAIMISSGNMFANASLIMLPMVGVLLLINLAVGIITRSAPQLNLFSFGFPITILSTMFVLYFGVSPLAHSFFDLIVDQVNLLTEMLGGISNGRK